MFENPRRGRQARNFTKNVPKILDVKSSSEQIFSENCRWVPPKDRLPIIMKRHIMSDKYGSRRILGSRLRTSSAQNSKWPRKKDIRNLYLFIIIRAPCDTTKQFLTLLQIPLHVKKWKFGQLSVNLGSESPPPHLHINRPFVLVNM